MTPTRRTHPRHPGLAAAGPRLPWARLIAALPVLLVPWACARTDGATSLAGTGGSGNSGGFAGGSGSSSAFDPNGTGLGGDGGTTGAGSDGGDLVEGGVCTDAGCSCIRIASLGHAGIYGGSCGSSGLGDTSALAQWLQTQSTASIDVYDSPKPTLTHDFLAPYNVIIVQWLRDVSDAGQENALWQFTPDEVSALADWVNAGGGLITLSGYDGDGQEINPVNTLLSFTAFKYNSDGTYGSVCSSSSCWSGTCAVTGWTAGSPIAAHVTQIGIDNGRSISVADAGPDVAIDCTLQDGRVCGAHQTVGTGHVFAFTDEWITYTSQWLGDSPCLPSSCAGNTTADDFQVPQFWYNAIAYASSSASCFVIHNPTIVPR